MQNNSTPKLPQEQCEVMRSRSYLALPLTQNQFAIIDLEDADLASFDWYAQYSPIIDGYYAGRSLGGRGNRKRVQMHRQILERVLNIELNRRDRVDHINHNTLDNRRCNLRLATPAQNGQNMRLAKNNTSGYKGVFWDRATNKWRAKIHFNGKCLCLGTYQETIDAAKAYNKAAVEYFGEFAFLNDVGGQS